MDNTTGYSNSTNLSGDPYLPYFPPLARSLPVQSILLGSILSILFCLLVQLLFTAPYHLPVSRLNWSLQVSAVLVAMLNICTRIGLVLQNGLYAGGHWPYMLDYVEVSLPDSSWSLNQTAAWYLLDGAVVGLVHLTNIQFLILLYPSSFETKAILIPLVPLAILASGMNLTSLTDDQSTIDIGDAVRNTSNSTLMLLFAIALLFWGYLNKRRAWRTDGGTAVFGAGAIALALIGTGVGFALIKADNVEWLPCLGWAITLWQSFFGWWWYVGAGMGIGELEDILKDSFPNFRAGALVRASSASATASAVRPSRIASLRARLALPQRRRPTALSRNPTVSTTSTTTPRPPPPIPTLLTLPLLRYLAPLYHFVRAAHLSARVVQFEQSGFLGMHGGWFGRRRRKEEAEGEGEGEGADEIEMEGEGEETEVEEEGEKEEEKEAARAARSLGVGAGEVGRGEAHGGGGRPRRWRMHDRTTY